MSNSKSDIVRALFAAYRSSDRKAVEDSLTEGFRFTSPYDDAIDKAEYFVRCWRGSEWLERHELERMFVQGEQAFVTTDASPKVARVFATPNSLASKATRSRASMSISARPTKTAFL